MSAITRFALRTNDGLALRAEWSVPESPRHVAVLCHPHPLHGGNMYANVIDHLFQTLPVSDVAVLRFNFRGVSGSDGRHDYGNREQFDVLAAVDEAVDRHPAMPVMLTGWSFGADVALSNPHPAIGSWCAIAPPLRLSAPDAMAAASDARPKVVVVPANDQFSSPEQTLKATAHWVNTTVSVIDDADHFLSHGLDEVLDLTLKSLPTD